MRDSTFLFHLLINLFLLLLLLFEHQTQWPSMEGGGNLNSVRFSFSPHLSSKDWPKVGEGLDNDE